MQFENSRYALGILHDSALSEQTFSRVGAGGLPELWSISFEGHASFLTGHSLSLS